MARKILRKTLRTFADRSIVAPPKTKWNLSALTHMHASAEMSDALKVTVSVVGKYTIESLRYGYIIRPEARKEHKQEVSLTVVRDRWV